MSCLTISWERVVKRSVSIGTLVLPLLVLSVGAQPPLKAQERTIAASYSIDTSAVTLSEPVYVTFRIRNEFGEPIHLDLGQDREQFFSFDISYPDGTFQGQVSKPIREGIGIPGLVSINPGEDYEQRLLLNEWIRFSNAGVYLIQMHVNRQLQTASGDTILLSPFLTQLDVFPRDEERLRNVCEELATLIETTLSIEMAFEAAEALSYIADPIAVPYLERALRSGKQVESRAIEGLIRIGNLDAAEVLLSVLSESDAQASADVRTASGTRATLVSQGLERMAIEADPDVREAIRRGRTQ